MAIEVDSGPRALSDDERLALVSSLRELTVAAQRLFDPGSSVSEFMLRLAERVGCDVALCIELPPDSGPRVLGSAGLSRRSLELALAPIDKLSRLRLPYPELLTRPFDRWLVPLTESPTEKPSLAFFLFFSHRPPLAKQLRGLVRRFVPEMRAALAHRRLYQELLQQNAVLRSLSEASSEGIMIASRDRRVLSYNHRFLEMWGLESLAPGELTGPLLRGAAELMRDPDAFLARVETIRADPTTESVDEFELWDGRAYESYSAPIRGEEGIFARGWYFRDITARKQAEQDRARLLAHEQAARAAAEDAVRLRDQFLSVVAHELKTPLTPLTLRLSALASRLDAGLPIDASLLHKARASMRRLTALIDDLLDFSRVQGGRLQLELQPLRLDSLVEEVAQSFRLISPRHRIDVELGGQGRVRGDPARMEQVLTNLVDNAIKYSPSGGTIRIRLEERANEVVLSVKDPGIGIPVDQQALLFERFFRARNAPTTRFGGLGLGLFICRDIVERHGGRIWVESTPGEGSTFHVALPLLRAAEREAGVPLH